MIEPTREQIKEAFKATIERWEKVVEDPSYYHKSECKLCGVYGEDQTCHKYCPIQLYGPHHVCRNTPHDKFSGHNDSENALAELNFLRKVYVWWIEEEEEEKKEEWVDYTHHISWETKDYPDAELPYLLYGTNYKGEEIVYVNENGKHICHNHEKEYRLEQSGETFRILKKI